MKFNFGDQSMAKMALLNQSMQKVLRKALSKGLMDFTIVDTYRDRETQDMYFTIGKSKVKWPNSKHNTLLSEAADVVPWINGKLSWNKFHCCVLAGIVLSSAKEVGVKVRWGGNWDMDGEPVTDQDFQDLVHYEQV